MHRMRYHELMHRMRCLVDCMPGCPLSLRPRCGLLSAPEVRDARHLSFSDMSGLQLSELYIIPLSTRELISYVDRRLGQPLI